MCRLKPVAIETLNPVACQEIPLGPPQPCVLGGPYAPPGTIPAVEMSDEKGVAILAFCSNQCRHLWLLDHPGVKDVALSVTVAKVCAGCGVALPSVAPSI